MKMSDYFEIKQCEYSYLKLIPISSVKNNKNEDLVSIVNTLYKSMFKSIEIDGKCIKIHCFKKVSFIIDMKNDECSFYLIVPTDNLCIFHQKLTETFGNITIEEVEKIPDVRNSCTKYAMEYGCDNVLSIAVDRRDNDLLGSNMSVMNILEDEDRVLIMYNFLPSSQKFLNSWKDYHVSNIAQYNQGKSLEKSLTSDKVAKTCGKLIFDVFELINNLVVFAMGGTETNNKDIFKRLVPVQELTKDSKQKEKAQIIKTQIMLLSQSKDSTRELNNAKALVNSFSVVKKDNYFVAKRVDTQISIKKKEKSCGIKKRSNKMKSIGIKRTIETVEDADTKKDIFNFEKFSLNTSVLSMSDSELGGNCVGLPGKTLINEYKINSVKHTETTIPDELIGGNVRYGTNVYRGNETVVTTSKNEDANCMPVVIMGKMGGGKSTFFENQGVDAVKNGEGLIVIDFIKNCELSDNIMRNIDISKCIVIDFSDYMCQESFSFNEMDMLRNMNNPMSRYECASLQSSAITQFVESLSFAEFSDSMGRYLDAACSAVLIHENKSIRDIMSCLTNHVKRAEYVKYLIDFKSSLPEEYQELIEEDLVALEELNEYREVKVNGKKSGQMELIGTANGKISGIVSRITQLKKSCPSLKLMYIRKPKNNINLTELMQQGKPIFFKMPQSKFPTMEAKNIIVSYLFSKIEMAGLVRSEVYKGKKLTTVNVICDEIHQAKDSFVNIERICTELRKYRTKLVLSTHGFHKISPMKDSLIEAGASIILLTGSSTKNFEVMKDEFEKFGFTPDDLVALSHCVEYKALCLIATKSGRHGCIVRLPDPVKNKIELQEIS